MIFIRLIRLFLIFALPNAFAGEADALAKNQTHFQLQLPQET